MNEDKKQSSKLFVFFEWVFAFLIINILTLCLVIPIITIFPAITAAYATMKESIEDSPYQVFRAYFRNFAKYSEKSFIVGLIITFIGSIARVSLWFYMTKVGSENILGQAGFWVMVVVLIILVFTILHLPLLIITFPSLKTGELFRTSLYICFRYFWVTFGMLLMLILMIIGVYLYYIWFFIGLSLPIFLTLQISRSSYYYLKHIDLEKIVHQVDIEEENNE